MEEVIERLNNVISHSKESIPITITGRVTNSDGSFVEHLEEPIVLDPAANYHVFLNDFTGWSNVPNVTEKNRYFHYKWRNRAYDITFPISIQSVDTYNNYLENIFLKHVHYTGEGDNKIFPVKFSYDLTVMRVIMQVFEEAEVNLSDNTWYREMGFEPKIYTKGIYKATEMADIVKSLNILIKSNLSLDWRFKGKRTNILYNITNSVPGGQMIAEKPNPVKRVVLSNKNFNSIELQFVTEDLSPVTFNGEEFVLTIIIERM